MQFFTLGEHTIQNINVRVFLLVAHVVCSVIICGGLSLIADSSILSATISIISAGLLVTLAFVGTKVKVERLFQLLELRF